MAKLSRDLAPGTLHPRENLRITGALAAVNAEIILQADGASTVSIDLRGTFNLTVALEGSVDGVNWLALPVRPLTGGGYVVAIAGTAAGAWVAPCAVFDRIRARVTAYTSGSATATLVASTGILDQTAMGAVSTLAVSATAAAGTGVTLTLPAPGAGLRQYLTAIRISRFATATLTAGAAPVLVTTTNLPGTPTFNVGAEALAQGVVDRPVVEDFAYPLMATGQNANVTIVCPATANVIWRATAWYYLAP